MKYDNNLLAMWILRFSLGIMYLYSGIELIIHPTSWVWAIPYWLRQVIEIVVNVESYIKFQGTVEIVFAAVMLAWFLPRVCVKWVAALNTLEFAAILILAFLPWNAQNFLTTFRDIGLLGASFALFILLRAKPSINT